mmetsp:Transcript_20032/g.45454  ORF Transcript_20032/g.45454 Transcript_20032/m.45454 type:complete len:208 (-) Transcript_20032:436-1059(-)
MPKAHPHKISSQRQGKICHGLQWPQCGMQKTCPPPIRPPQMLPVSLYCATLESMFHYRVSERSTSSLTTQVSICLQRFHDARRPLDPTRTYSRGAHFRQTRHRNTAIGIERRHTSRTCSLPVSVKKMIHLICHEDYAALPRPTGDFRAIFRVQDIPKGIVMRGYKIEQSRRGAVSVIHEAMHVDTATPRVHGQGMQAKPMMSKNIGS